MAYPGIPHYDAADDFLIRRLFNANASDADIAAALRKRGRPVQSEAVRKRRRILGLKKVPTFRRWTWAPSAYEGGA
jgi:hypothetical protein